MQLQYHYQGLAVSMHVELAQIVETQVYVLFSLSHVAPHFGFSIVLATLHHVAPHFGVSIALAMFRCYVSSGIRHPQRVVVIKCAAQMQYVSTLQSAH